MDKPLRILAVVNVPWDPRLGAARVWIELTDEWRKAGHTVEKFCLTDAFPGPAPSSAFAAIRLMLFPSLAAKFIRNNATRFDVIDALVGTVPFSKRSLSFAGLLVARSVGLFHLYEKFERMAATRWPSKSTGKLLGRPFYWLFSLSARARSQSSIRHCDLLNVPNSDEVICARDELRFTKPVVAHPYGLAPTRAQALSELSVSPETRWRKKKIVFIGMWSPRKGAREWGRLIRDLRAAVPEVSFLLLGTMIATDTVWNDLEMAQTDFIEIVPQFDPDELPRLLSDCAVGAFPSYVEGFGMALVEQLAAGIPTVAYDVPGPRDILRDLSQLLVPPGDVEAFVKAITKILASDLESYGQLSRQSKEIARRFSWPEIARDTITDYRKHLSNARE